MGEREDILPFYKLILNIFSSLCTEFSQAFKRNTNVCVWFFKLGMVQAVIWFFASLSLLTITNLNIIQIHWDQNKWPDHLLILILSYIYPSNIIKISLAWLEMSSEIIFFCLYWTIVQYKLDIESRWPGSIQPYCHRYESMSHPRLFFTTAYKYVI